MSGIALKKKKGAGKRLPALAYDDGKPSQAPPQQKIQKKKDLLEAVRKLKPSQSAPVLGQTQKKSQLVEMLSLAGEDGTTKEIETLQNGIHSMARTYNNVKMEADRKAALLDRLRDSVIDVKAEVDMLEENLQNKTPESHRINALMGETGKVKKDMGDKLFYQNQLKHMTRRLSKNQMAFDAYLAGMEEAYNDCVKEYDEVKLLQRQLDAGNTQAMFQLQDTKAQLEEERGVREAALETRRADAENSRRIEEWRKEKDQQRKDYEAELRGDLSSESENQLQFRLRETERNQQALKEVTKAQNEKVGSLEDAFQKIRQATGVRTVDEMVEKFMGQGSNTQALEAEQREAEERLARARKRSDEASNALNEMKASGIGGTELNREVYDTLDEDISQARAALKMNKAACERLESVLVAVRQGAMGLAQRLTPFKGMIEHHEEMNMAHSGNESLDSLHISELKLTKMVEATGQPAGSGGGQSSLTTNADGDGDGEDGGEEGKPRLWTPHGNDDPSVSTNNLRVRSMRMVAAMEEQGDPDVDDDSEEEEEEEELLLTVDEAGAGVPTRKNMKKLSDRQFTNTLKAREVAEKRKVMLERMAGDDGEVDPALGNLRMRKKAQGEATERLSQQHTHTQITNSRDDALTKSSTFLTSMPTLN